MSEPKMIKRTFISKCHNCGKRVKVSYEAEDWVKEPSAADYAETHVVCCQPCVDTQKNDPDYEYLELDARFGNEYGFTVELNQK